MTPLRTSTASTIGERLRKSVEVLNLIENCRRTTGDVGLGLAIERLIVQRELSELEEAAHHAETARITRIDRDVDVVIPVRRVIEP